MGSHEHSIPVTRVAGMRTRVTPAWQLLYEYINTLEVDSHISFDTLSEILGFDAAKKGRSAINRMWQELEKGGRTLERDEIRGYFLRKMP